MVIGGHRHAAINPQISIEALATEVKAA